MPGGVVPVTTGSYRWYESLIPFHVPKEVENCEAFLRDQEGSSKLPPDERQRATQACTAVVKEHGRVKLFQKALVALGVVGLVLWLRGRRGNGPTGGGGAGITETTAGAVPRGQPSPAVRSDSDRAWAESTRDALGGWTAGSIPHMRIQPGTRFILSALERARQDHDARGGSEPFHILEVGSDAGRLADLLVDALGVRVHATDVKPIGGLNDGSAPLIRFEQASATDLPAEAGSVPAWVSSFTWEYVGPRVLDEARRVLSDGGTIVAISHWQGSATSRMLVALGRLARRALDLEKMDRGSRKKSRKYQDLLADIERETEWGGSWLERAINLGAFRNYARWAYFGQFKPMHRRGLEVQAAAGRGLEWIIGKSTDDIRRLFEERGFEVVEMRPVHFRLLGILPSVSHEGLGIVARKRADAGPKAGPTSGGAPASGSGSGSPAKAGGGEKGKPAASPVSRFAGLFFADEGTASPPLSLMTDPDEVPAADGVIEGAAWFGGLSPWTAPAVAPAAAVAY